MQSICKVVLLSTGLFLSSAANAACYQDDKVSEQARRAASQHFPDLLSRMPDTLICDGQDFPPNIGGDFNAAIWTIRLNRHAYGPYALPHELGHAAAALRGLDDRSAGGHGPGWMSIMVGAGLGQEAERISRLDHIFPGVRKAYLRALNGGPNSGSIARNDQPLQQGPVCFDQPVQTEAITIVNGRPMRNCMITMQRVCYQAY